MDKIVTNVYPRHTAVGCMVNALCKRYEFLSRVPVGKSLLGREIFGLSLGRVRDKVLYVGATHGSEWLTILLLLRFTESLCVTIERDGDMAGTRVNNALTGRGLMIVPCLNPDGVEIALGGAQTAMHYSTLVRSIAGRDTKVWQANARGVDLNHNFDAGWDELREMERAQGIRGPAMTQYGGSAPESEPESKAITALCRAHPFRHLISFHSQGEEIFWQYGDDTPPRTRLMAGVLAASSGYKLAEPTGLASHGGLKDWFIKEMRRPGFTIEIGLGQNPLPLELLDSIYERLEEMMLLAALM